MAPLGMMAAGLGLVVVDVRINGFDLVPDLVGWVVVVGGLGDLAGRSPWFTTARVAAVFGVVVGVPQQFAKAGPALSALESLVLGVLVFSTCTGIRAVVTSDRSRDTANVLRWSHLFMNLLGALAFVLFRPTEVTGGPGAVGVVVVAGIVFGLTVWLVVFLWSSRWDPELGPLNSAVQPDPDH